MARLATLFVLLCAFWLLLSGQFKAWLLVVGLLSILLVVYVSWRMRLVDEEGLPLWLSRSAITYWPWLMVEIVKSAINVTRIVLNPKLPIAPTLVRVRGGQGTAAGLTTYANSITLTPGTISVEVSGGNREILVHALRDDIARELESDVLNQRVVTFERRTP